VKTEEMKQEGRKRRNLTAGKLILGFHRALLHSITFISQLNAFDYTKLRS